MARALEAHPDNPNVLYNLACCEALAGRRSEALAHVIRSAELDPRVPGWASRDSDLDSIRDEDGFPVPVGARPLRGPGARAADQPGLLGRLEPRSLRRAEGGAGAVGQRTESGLAEIAVIAGVFPPLGHPGTTILGIPCLGVKRCATKNTLFPEGSCKALTEAATSLPPEQTTPRRGSRRDDLEVVDGLARILEVRLRDDEQVGAALRAPIAFCFTPPIGTTSPSRPSSPVATIVRPRSMSRPSRRRCRARRPARPRAHRRRPRRSDVDRKVEVGRLHDDAHDGAFGVVRRRLGP